MIKQQEHLEGDALSEVLSRHVPKELLIEALGPKTRHHDVLEENLALYLLGHITAGANL